MASPTMVLLRHDVPGEGAHYDFMAQLDGAGRKLRTWRVRERIDLISTDHVGVSATFRAERIADHREIYLAFEGDLGGGRGSVTRVAEGVVLSPQMVPPAEGEPPDQAVFEAQWRAGPNMNRRLRFRGGPTSEDTGNGGGGGSLWTFHVEAC